MLKRVTAGTSSPQNPGPLNTSQSTDATPMETRHAKRKRDSNPTASQSRARDESLPARSRPPAGEASGFLVTPADVKRRKSPPFVSVDQLARAHKKQPDAAGPPSSTSEINYKTDARRLKVEISKPEDRALLGMKRGQSYKDLSYKEHARLNDSELEALSERHPKLKPQELYELYSQQVKNGSLKDNTEEGKFELTGVDLPNSRMAPHLMQKYGDMHYRATVNKTDETASSRNYEAQYAVRLQDSAGPVAFRALTLPARDLKPPKNDGDQNNTMINTLGSVLDANTGTSPSKTIGSGAVYKTVFKDFQRTLELLNSSIDTQVEAEVITANDYAASKHPTAKIDNEALEFQIRTHHHTKMLPKVYLNGALENETDPSKKSLIQEAAAAIDEAIREENEGPIKDFLQPVIDKPKTETQRYEAFARVLALNIKTEKRILSNHGILDTPLEQSELVAKSLGGFRIVGLQWAEETTNKLLKDSFPAINQQLRQESNRRSFQKKELDNLPDLGIGELKKEQRKARATQSSQKESGSTQSKTAGRPTRASARRR